MVRRIVGITGIGLWAILIAFAAVAAFQAKANGEQMFDNLPEGWKVEESSVVPQDQAAAIVLKLGGKINRLTNTVLSIEGRRIQVNVLHCPTKTEAEKIYKAILEVHNGLAAAAVLDNKTVIEFAKSDDVELMNQARRGLGLPDAESDAEQSDESDINAKVAQLNIRTATLDDVIRIFGEPKGYSWEGKTLQKSNLPDRYIVHYPNGFDIFMIHGRIKELRHYEPGYAFRGKFQIGASLDEVIRAIGRPTRIVTGQPNKHRNGVLYKDIDGEKGNCYYGRKKSGLRCFFKNYKVNALYVTSNDLSGRKSSRSASEPEPDSASQQADIESLAEDLVDSLAEGDYEGAVKNFDDTMKSALPAKKLEEVWNSLITQSGDFVEQLGTRKEKIQQYDVIFVTCEFERAVLDAKVVFDNNKKVAGLFFIPGQKPSAN